MFCTVSRQLSPLQAVSPNKGYRYLGERENRFALS
jgi:hypothetical protein